MIAEKIRSLVWADYILYVLTDPRELYRRIKSGKEGAFILSFFIPALVTFAGILTLSIPGSETSFFYQKISYGWIMLFIYTSFKILVYASLIDSVSQFMGYRGSIREIITLVNYSMFPKVFILPLVYFFNIVNFAPGFFYVFFIVILFIWYVFILVQGISEMHSIEFGKALAVYLIPGLIIGLAMFFILVLLVIMTAAMIF